MAQDVRETLNSSGLVLAPKQVQALKVVPVLECPSQLMDRTEMAAPMKDWERLPINLGKQDMKEIGTTDCLFLK